MAEMIDIYNENRELTGTILPRKTKLQKGQYMLYVLALIQDSAGHFLITRRALDKKWAAGAWEIPGGGASAGESSWEAVSREVREETGLSITRSSSKCIYSYKNDDEKYGDNYFCDIYLCNLDYHLDDLQIDKSEVIDAKLADMNMINTLKCNQGFLHYQRICEALSFSTNI